MVPSSLRLVAFATLAAGAVAGILPELGSKDSLSKAEFAKLVGSRNNVRGRALVTGAYCNSHSDCGSDEYCDTNNQCYSLTSCSSFCDAIDGSCPGDDSCRTCSSHGDCGSDEYCDVFNHCYFLTSCSSLCDAIDGSCPGGDSCLPSCTEKLYTGDCGALSDESDSWYGDYCCASSSSDCCDPNVGAIVGIVIACVVAIALSIVACCWCCKCGCFKPSEPMAPPAQVVMVPQPGTAVVGTAVV